MKRSKARTFKYSHRECFRPKRFLGRLLAELDLASRAAIGHDDQVAADEGLIQELAGGYSSGAEIVQTLIKAHSTQIKGPRALTTAADLTGRTDDA